MSGKDLARFLTKVDKTEHQRCKDHGCWIWVGCISGVTKHGYGKFWLQRKTIQAHRASYILHKGAIPEGMVVQHQCPYEDGTIDNRRCVNPDHLTVGTQQKNIVEGYHHNRRKNCCPKCGGDYATMKDGKRRCRPCYNAYRRNLIQQQKERTQR